MVLQSTRPQTLSYTLSDSPVGQLAWITEKFMEWVDPACPIGIDRLLTNVMLYWVTGTAGSSARLYYESAQIKGRPVDCPVPSGVAVFPHDWLGPYAVLLSNSMISYTGRSLNMEDTSPRWRFLIC